MGMCFVAGSCRSNLHTWMPSMSGIIRSRTTRSGLAVRAFLNASGPSLARTTRNPAPFRLYSTSSAASGSSSTTRTVFFPSAGPLEMLRAAMQLTLLAGMADISSFINVNDFFSDVRGVVGNPFEAFGNHHQVQRACDRGRVFDHEAG